MAKTKKTEPNRAERAFEAALVGLGNEPVPRDPEERWIYYCMEISRALWELDRALADASGKAITVRDAREMRDNVYHIGMWAKSASLKKRPKVSARGTQPDDHS
jgi:hypothetical protein